MTRYTYRIEDPDDFDSPLYEEGYRHKQPVYVVMVDGMTLGWFLSRDRARAWCKQQEKQ